MVSRGSANKIEDEEQQSVSLLQRDAEAVTRDFQLKLTVLDLIEEGHKAAAVAIGTAIAIGIILGFTLPVDQNIPVRYARASNVLGWTYFACWWIGWYPQMIQNALLKSVVGISFDFTIYNWIGFFCYSTFNVALFWSPHIREEYRVSHGGQNSDVRANDLAFSLHCNLMSTLMLVQMLIYDGGGQRVTALCWAITSGFFVVCGGYLLGAGLHWQGFDALGFLYLLSYLKLMASLIKCATGSLSSVSTWNCLIIFFWEEPELSTGLSYAAWRATTHVNRYFPQVYLQYRRKSTIGWSASNAFTDLSGGVFSLAQQSLDAYALQDISLVTGDPVKFGLALVSITYCVVLLVQHYLLYTERRPSHYALKSCPLEGSTASHGTLIDDNRASDDDNTTV